MQPVSPLPSVPPRHARRPASPQRDSHNDLVTPEPTVARRVVDVPGHYEPVPAWIPAHDERGPDQRITQGYTSWSWQPYTYQSYEWISGGYITSDPYRWWTYERMPDGPQYAYQSVGHGERCGWTPDDGYDCWVASYSFELTWMPGG